VAGARLSHIIGCYDSTLGYDKIAFMQSFWNEEGFMNETGITNGTSGTRSGIGSAPLTVSVLNFDPTLGCDSATFQPCSDCALSSLKDVGRRCLPGTLPNQPTTTLPYFGFLLEDQLYGGQVSYKHKPLGTASAERRF
jgi:glucoamylase